MFEHIHTQIQKWCHSIINKLYKILGFSSNIEIIGPPYSSNKYLHSDTQTHGEWVHHS